MPGQAPRGIQKTKNVTGDTLNPVDLAELHKAAIDRSASSGH